MAAFIPSKDPEVNEAAFAKVRADKEREVGAGFDGSWVAHPGMVELCKEIFTGVLGDSPNQLDKQRDDVSVTADDLLDAASTPGERTLDGLRGNVSVGIQYLQAWLRGQRRRRHPQPHGGRRDRRDLAPPDLAVAATPGPRSPPARPSPASSSTRWWSRSMPPCASPSARTAFAAGSWEAARRLFVECALDPDFPDFLTLPAYAEVLQVERA